MSSSSSSPRFRPTRTATQKDETLSNSGRPPSDHTSYDDSEEAMVDAMSIPPAGPTRGSHQKLNQILQNFHMKAAVLILQGRMRIPTSLNKDGTIKSNMWFQLQTDETDAFRDELRLWRTYTEFFAHPPPAMIIEVFLDTSKLKKNEILVVIDDAGKRWDVAEALKPSNDNNEGIPRDRRSHTDVVLERWKFELLETSADPNYDFGANLPVVYKKNIAFFRALYALIKLVPAWRLVKGLLQNPSRRAANLGVTCRVISEDDYRETRPDPLSHPLYNSNMPVMSSYSLGEITTPAGKIRGELSHRNDYHFRVDDQDALLSSQFLGADETYFQPSLAHRSTHRQDARSGEVGSLPVHHQQQSRDAEPIQAYGSMSTFHGANAPPLGSSPISALRNARTMGSDTNSPPAGSSLRPRPFQTTNPAMRAIEGANSARRASLSFQPFKAGSLSSSPGPGTPVPQAAYGGDMFPPQSPASLSRNSGISALHQARNRSSLTAGMPAALRGIPVVQENTNALSGSGSPKPPPVKYSSSFQHRRGRLSYGGVSRVDDDQSSSGRHSLSSSAQRGSEVEGGAGGSSGSLQTDEDNIADFLKLLDSKKTLPSFEPAKLEASASRTNAQLNRFKSMQEPNNTLVESMTTSAMLHRSSSASSRQLSSVPPMVAATSVSTSSSPGKPISPHTPHTPAIPSRLSAAANADYTQPQRQIQRSRTMPQTSEALQIGGLAGTNAIDIPTSPRPFYLHNRRSSSVTQQNRSVVSDEDGEGIQFNRSVSLGDNDRAVPSLESLRLGQASVTADSSGSRERLRTAAQDMDQSPAATSQESHEGPAIPRGLPSSTSAPYRPRIGRSGGRGLTPPQGGSYASLPLERGSGSATSERPNSRYSFSRSGVKKDEDEDELLFNMSEVGRDESRRSLEEGRGGASERGGYESSRGGDSASSSRVRGNRRGW